MCKWLKISAFFRGYLSIYFLCRLHHIIGTTKLPCMLIKTLNTSNIVSDGRADIADTKSPHHVNAWFSVQSDPILATMNHKATAIARCAVRGLLQFAFYSANESPSIWRLLGALCHE